MTPHPPPETTAAAIRERLLIEPCDLDIQRTCRMNWPDDPKSWCGGCLMHAAADIRESLEAAVKLIHAMAEKPSAEYSQREYLFLRDHPSLYVVANICEQAADLLDAQARQQAQAAESRVLALTKALEEVCIRIEASRKPGETETHRELSAHRQRTLDAVYAVAEAALPAPFETREK